MNTTTIVRERPPSALIVGATGTNVVRVVNAFQRKFIITTREDHISGACDRIAIDMPHVVVVLVAPANEGEREALADRSLAVGALVVHIDPELDDETFAHILDHTISKVLDCKTPDEAGPRSQGTKPTTPPPEDLDEGWK